MEHNEWNVFERVGMPNIISVLQGENLTSTHGDVYGRINQIVRDPMERFAIHVNAISLNISKIPYPISETDIVKMIMTAKQVPKIQYKNPSVYVLGYIASDGGKGITGKKMSDVRKILPEMHNPSIVPADIIRYARLWMGLVKNKDAAPQISKAYSEPEPKAYSEPSSSSELDSELDSEFSLNSP